MHDYGMRWLICLVVMATAADARAEFVVNDPPIVRRCPRAKTWDLVVGCLAKIGFTPKVTHQLRGAKLMSLTQKDGIKDVDSGVLLYVEKAGEWRLGGHFQSYGSHYQILGLQAVTVGKKRGYRIDIEQASAFTLMVDNISMVPAQLFMKRALFCNGDSQYCPESVSRCDVTVQGKTWFTFRGTLEYEENVVVSKGDRSRAGQYCAGSARVHLGWP